MLQRRTFIFLGGAVASIAAASYLKPVMDTARPHGSKGWLEPLIPERFGGWQRLYGQQKGIVSPDLQAQLDSLYSDTLAHTYVEAGSGRTVMLSLAYGANQSRSLRVHKPETCYSAQGFQIGSTSSQTVIVNQKPLPVMQLVATQGPRVEFITYWIRSGDDIVRGWVEQNLSTLKHGLQGYIPDGILVRVSTIHQQGQDDYATHAEFIQSVLAHVGADAREVLVGQRFPKV